MKLLKNTTVSPVSVSDTGITIAASPGSYIIPPQDYMLWAASTDVIPLINSGVIVINDGVLDLNPANGIALARAIDFLEHPDTAFNVRFLAVPERPNGFASKNVQEAIEEAKSAIEGKISVLPTFLNNGLTSNKWLSLDGAMGPSDTLPAVTSYDSKIAGLTYINTNNDSDVDIEFYKNGTAPGNLLFVWQIRDKRHAWKTNGLDSYTFMRGDRISCFAKAVVGVSARDVIVNVFVQSTNSLVGEGGGAVGIT